MNNLHSGHSMHPLGRNRTSKHVISTMKFVFSFILWCCFLSLTIILTYCFSVTSGKVFPISPRIWNSLMKMGPGHQRRVHIWYVLQLHSFTLLQDSSVKSPFFFLSNNSQMLRNSRSNLLILYWNVNGSWNINDVKKCQGVTHLNSKHVLSFIILLK